MEQLNISGREGRPLKEIVRPSYDAISGNNVWNATPFLSTSHSVISRSRLFFYANIEPSARKYGENFAPSFVPSWTLKSCFELNPSRSWRVKSLLRNDLLKFVARCFLQVEEKYSTIFHRIIPPIFFISTASSICSIIDIVIFNWSLKCCLWTLDIRVRDNKIIRFFQILLYIIILLYI